MYLRDKQKPDIKATKNGKKKTVETVQACSYSQEEFFFSMGKTTFGSLYGWRHFGRVTEELRFSSNGYGGQAKSESPRVSETSFFRKIDMTNFFLNPANFATLAFGAYTISDNQGAKTHVCFYFFLIIAKNPLAPLESPEILNPTSVEPGKH